MIVEFADRRRRSDASSGSNAVRNGRLRRLSRSSGSGRSLIVSFAELRRSSTASAEDAPPRSIAARGHGRSECRPSVGDVPSSSSSSPRRPRRQRDPIGVSWRSMISMSGRSLVDDEGADRPSKPDPEERGVIVEFPKKERRRSGRDPAPRGGELSLSGIFRRKQQRQQSQQSQPSEEQPSREPGKHELQQQQGQEEQRPRPSVKPTRPKTRQERRRYSGAIDWRETSIDWGDEEDEECNQETSPSNCDSSSSSSSHRDSFVPDKVGRRPSNPAKGQRERQVRLVHVHEGHGRHGRFSKCQRELTLEVVDVPAGDAGVV